MTRGLCILGSTGSIGQNSLRVVESLPARFRIVALVAGRNLDVLAKQVAEFHPCMAVVSKPEDIGPLRERVRNLGYAEPVRIAAGVAGQVEAATLSEVDLVVSACHGTTGLVATYQAVQAGKRVALANKEVMVVAGELVTRAAKERAVEILPIDSEHCAVHQCLRAGHRQEVKRLVLTASGGPFLETPSVEFQSITPDRALQHPIWKMGGRVTIDSSTLMNKGLEIIEAHWLFGTPASKIDVLIHPESIIHSMIEFHDGSVMAQLSVPDMRLPIQYALTYPERLALNAESLGLDLLSSQRLSFRLPDAKKFPCLGLARAALEKGGVMPGVMNAADEVAVEAFLDHRLKFSDIPRVIETVMTQTPQARALGSLEDVLEADREARRRARELVATISQ